MSRASARDDRAARGGAFAVATFGFVTFLAPALLAPGRIGLINLVGAAVAVTVGAAVWRNSMRPFEPGALAFRISVVGPGVVITAAMLFAMLLMQAWLYHVGGVSPRLERLELDSLRFWAFPYSPFTFYAAPLEGLPPVGQHSARIVALTLTVTAAFGGLFTLLTFVAPIPDYETLRRHALIWRGMRVDDPMERLRARGVRGLEPLWTPTLEMPKAPVSGRLFLRAFIMLTCFGLLLFAPFALRLLQSMEQPEVRRFFDGAALESAFLPLWASGIWGVCLVGAALHVAAYIRLGFLLSGKR